MLIFFVAYDILDIKSSMASYTESNEPIQSFKLIASCFHAFDISCFQKVSDCSVLQKFL